MARPPQNLGLFLEFDGVLVERPRLADDGSIPWLPGALDALDRIDTSRQRLFVATSREDIAFGGLRERDFRRFCEAFVEALRERSVHLTKIYSCPWHPKGRARFRRESVFRRPAPGMFKIAQQEFDLNLGRCWMVGQTTSDILSGSRAGLGTILVRTGVGGRDGAYQIEPHFVEPDVARAIERINDFEAALRC